MKSKTAWARWRYEMIQKAKVHQAKRLADPEWLEANRRRYIRLEGRNYAERLCSGEGA